MAGKRGFLLVADGEWLDYHTKHLADNEVVFYRGPGGNIVNIDEGGPVFCLRKGEIPRQVHAWGVFQQCLTVPNEEAWTKFGTQLGADTESHWRKQAAKVLALSNKKNGKIVAIRLAAFKPLSHSFNPIEVGIKINDHMQRGQKLTRKEADPIIESISAAQSNPEVGSTLGLEVADEAEYYDDKEYISKQEQQLSEAGVFDPKNIADARERILASIVRRRGQPAFRRQLLESYEGQCAISSCAVEVALDAAHIVPYQGSATHHPTNGLLLRADLHTLFDLGLIAIATETMTVLIAPELEGTYYQEFAGKRLHMPSDPTKCPSREALDRHRESSAFPKRAW